MKNESLWMEMKRTKPSLINFLYRSKLNKSIRLKSLNFNRSWDGRTPFLYTKHAQKQLIACSEFEFGIEGKILTWKSLYSAARSGRISFRWNIVVDCWHLFPLQFSSWILLPYYHLNNAHKKPSVIINTYT